MLEQGIPLDDMGYLPPELPPLTIELAPNFAPRTPWITLSRPGEVHRAWPGERVELPAGATFDLTPAHEGRDQQDFLRLSVGGFAVRAERVVRRWHTTAAVLEDGGDHLQVPDREGSSFTMILVTTDDRQGQTWATFEFDVVSP